MGKNVIFCGSAENNLPLKREALATGAMLPGNILLLASTGKFKKHDVNATAAAPLMVYIADLNMHDGVTTAYATDDTVQAFQPQSGEFYNAIGLASQVFVKDAALTSDGAGRLKLATLGTDAVICYADETVTPGADALIRVKFR